MLDIGSGSGYLTHVLANLVEPNGTVIGVDHIQELVDMATHNMKKNEEGRKLLSEGRVKFVKADGRLGYPDGGELVFFSRLLGHGLALVFACTSSWECVFGIACPCQATYIQASFVKGHRG